ncbi:MAG: hypothetical protein ACI82G_003386 [Bradymonadia bacterium]|jgi:hypothetical protein
MHWTPGNLEGLIPLLAGTYLWLVAGGTLPRNPRDLAAMEAWRAKWGRLVRFVAPLVVLHGVLLLLGVL